MARQTYDDHTKAAVMAALLAGQSISQVAEQYNIPRGTVAVWSAQTDRSQPVANTKKAELGDLIVEYLRETLTTLTEQQRHFRDKAWLKQQPADQLAVLHGVSADKGIRLLAALEPLSADEDQDSEAD